MMKNYLYLCLLVTLVAKNSFAERYIRDVKVFIGKEVNVSTHIHIDGQSAELSSYAIKKLKKMPSFKVLQRFQNTDQVKAWLKANYCRDYQGEIVLTREGLMIGSLGQGKLAANKVVGRDIQTYTTVDCD